MELAALRPDNADEAAHLHALAMAEGLGGDAWSAATFRTLLGTPGTFGWMIPGQGLIMVRHAADEAEIFTIGVAPAARRQGTARTLLETACIALKALKVERLLLEVAVDNMPARRFYEGAGFETAGRRTGYYKRGAGRVDALVMALAL
jgi:ribosomal-protein-alanine N-acetyltransferase